MSFILDALKKSEENRTGDSSPKPGKHVLLPQLPRKNRGLFIAACVLIPLLSLIFGLWIGSKPVDLPPEKKLISKTAPLPRKAIVSANRVAQPIPRQQHAEAVSLAPQSRSAGADVPLQHNISAPVPQRLKTPEPIIPVATQTVTDLQQLPPQIDTEPREQEHPYYAELAQSLRRQIAPLEVSLHFFSPDPARRMLRINGKIRHEKEQITDQLSIVEIQETATLFNYRGNLFLLPAPGR